MEIKDALAETDYLKQEIRNLKTNIEIATLKNNKTFYSIYNPQRDIDFFCSNEKIKSHGENYENNRSNELRIRAM